MSKTSACFICGTEFPVTDLSAHEKVCFDSMQSSDDTTQYTRSDDISSSRSSLHDYSVISTNSASSGESLEKKKERCYICGSDVPIYLASIHERNCKKSWENSLLTTPETPQNGMKRGSSKTDVRRNSSLGTYLRKSHSVADISLKAPDDAFKTPKRSTAYKNKSLKSRSYADLTLSNKKTKPKLYNGVNGVTPTTTLSKTNSMQNLSKRKETPIFVECRTCGKQYSKHSIDIHIRQCEKTLELQKRAGTNNDYKKKSKSLHDLTAVTVTRPSSANRKSTKKFSLREILSSEPKSQTPVSKMKEISKNKPSIKKSLFPLSNTIENDDSSEDIQSKTPERPPSASGFQKCYLCHQLFGSRSLPIHEKQCIKKWERSLEQNKQQKKKLPQKDIQVIPFGKAKETELEQKQNKENEDNNITETKVPEATFKRNLIRNKQKEMNDSAVSKSPKTFGFVNCVFCSRSYGHFSIEIHEKNCRERPNIENKTRERIEERTNRENKKKVKGDSLETPTNHKLELITCDDCNRKFLASAIEKHRMHCKTIEL